MPVRVVRIPPAGTGCEAVLPSVMFSVKGRVL